METWLFIIISLCVAAFLKSLYDFFFPKLNLPPGPTRVPLIGNFLLFRKSLVDFEPVIRNLHSKYGPILTVHFGSRPVIFVSSDSLSHQALVQKGAVFADRTEALPISKIFSSHSGPVRVVDHFRYAMFYLLVLMCFGDKLKENQIREIETIQRRLLLRFPRQQLKQQLRSKEQEDDSDPEENRKLSEGEMLFEEISGVVGEGGEEVKREDLQKMPYLKAVILEGLRRHPPAHFLLPHSVTQDTTLEGFAIPKNTLVNFMVADMGWNPKIWDDPMAFKPERFMNSKDVAFFYGRDEHFITIAPPPNLGPAFLTPNDAAIEQRSG
ncbi:unnamed protein product, partial [Vitis vinifera]